MPERRILIADDEALFRASAADSLRVRFPRVEVLEAEDGASALDVMARNPVDVLITDLQMPNLGGIELVARLSGHRMPIQVIVVSAHITDETRCTLDGLGALMWIDKPIDLDMLHHAVERMLAVPRAHVSGVTLAGFVQLLEMERQTCALRVSSRDGVGTLVFESGQLRDAWTGELSGDLAALAILRFRACTLDVIGVLRSDVPRVTMPLSFLLLESARRADEEAPVAGQWELMSLVPPAFGPEPRDDRAHAAAVDDGWPRSEPPPRRAEMDVDTLLRGAMAVEGTLGAAVVDAESNALLGTLGGPGLSLDKAAVGNAEVLRAKQRVVAKLGLAHAVEDILIRTDDRYDLIRPLSEVSSSLFLYLVLDRTHGNLVLARRAITKAVAEAYLKGASAPGREPARGKDDRL